MTDIRAKRTNGRLTTVRGGGTSSVDVPRTPANARRKVTVMPTIIRPPALKPGDLIAISALSSGHG